MPTDEETMQTIKAAQQAAWIENNMTPELESAVARGYYVKGRDTGNYWDYCRQFDRPLIRINPFRDAFQVLMTIEETQKPTRKTSTRIGKLRKEWEARLFPEDAQKDPKQRRCLDMSGKEVSLYRLSEDQAIELASALWAIVGQPGAYMYAEPPDEEEDE